MGKMCCIEQCDGQHVLHVNQESAVKVVQCAYLFLNATYVRYPAVIASFARSTDAHNFWNANRYNKDPNDDIFSLLGFLKLSGSFSLLNCWLCPMAPPLKSKLFCNVAHISSLLVSSSVAWQKNLNTTEYAWQWICMGYVSARRLAIALAS